MTLVADNVRMTVAGYGTVITGFTARFESSEVVGVTGPSGAGKSTLARGLCGMQQLAGGRVHIDDHGPGDTAARHLGSTPRATKLAPRRGAAAAVQLGFQDPLSTFPPHLRLEVPLLDAARAAGDSRASARRELAALLSELGIPDALLRRRPPEVSGGQLQRLALARALAARPLFLVCDEITSAVDPLNERQALKLIGRYRRLHKLGIIIISHDIGLLARNCDRVIVMDRGTAVETGDPATMFSQPEHPTTVALCRAFKDISGGTA